MQSELSVYVLPLFSCAASALSALHARERMVSLVAAMPRQCARICALASHAILPLLTVIKAWVSVTPGQAHALIGE